MADEPRTVDLGIEHAILTFDVEVVRHYGKAHPDAWVCVRFENDPPPVRVVALFSGDDVPAHAAALRSMVAFPDRLEVQWSRWPAHHLKTVRAALEQFFTTKPGSITGLGDGWGTVDARLRADQEPLAAELHERYGDAIALTVGALPYPMDRPPTPMERSLQKAMRSTPRPSLPEEVSIRGLEASLELAEDAVNAGLNGRGRVVLRNTRRTRLHFESEQPLLGSVVDPGTGTVIGGFTGAVAGTGLSVRLKPGEATGIGMMFSTASYDKERGYTVPPGQYVVRAEVPIFDHPTDSSSRRRVLRVPPANLTVVGG